MPFIRYISRVVFLLFVTSAVASAEPRTEFVDPVITGPNIFPLLELPGASNRDLRHFVAFDAARTNGFLYVHLAGSGGLPENSQQIIRFAAQRGFHAVSIAYPNWPSVGDLTAALGDPAAAGAVRAERLFGVDASPLVNVDANNGVIHRLTRLLVYLHDAYPDEHWNAFFGSDQPQWSRIVVGGHSQGAGHAAYLGQEFALVGALLFAGPGDAVAGVGVANWLLRPLRIAPTALYGFVHRQDPNFNFFQTTQGILGLAEGGPSQDIDLVAQSQWSANRLTSSRTDISSGNFHGAVVVDGSLPATPGYEPVWDYMLRVALFRNDFDD